MIIRLKAVTTKTGHFFLLTTTELDQFCWNIKVDQK